jgi:tRNA1Val (adenine37-N6)-methyltransferase
MRSDSGKRNEHDEKFIARHEVFGGIDDFCACASRLLKHGGKFYTVWRPDRLADLVCALLQHRLEVKKMVFVHATPQSQPSVVLVQSTKGAAAGNTVSRPLFLHDNREDAKNNVLSEDAANIYANCSFDKFI